jgi:hypothetical protein
MSNERRFGPLSGLLFEPLALDARDLQRGRTAWLRERSGVEQEKPGMAAARDENHRLVGAASRLRDGPRLRNGPFRDAERLGFCQPDLGVAAEGSKPAVYALPVGEIAVEERHSVDAPVRNAQVTRLQIDPTQREGFELGLGARLLNLSRQPLR